jgi:hypothetical protein
LVLLSLPGELDFFPALRKGFLTVIHSP